MEARKQAEKLKLFERINPGSIPLAEVTFGVLARSYIQIKLGENAIKPKASTTAYTEQLIFANNLLPRWEETVATTMEPYDIELWLQAISIDSKEPEKSGCKKQDEEDCKERQNQAGRSKKAKGYEWDTLTKYRLVDERRLQAREQAQVDSQRLQSNEGSQCESIEFRLRRNDPANRKRRSPS